MPITHRTNGTAEVCGLAVGILSLEQHLPAAPGDINNASSYDYPVRYKLVPGMTMADFTEENPASLDSLIEKARELEAEGVHGIIANSGHFIKFQSAVANAVRIPVALSPLLQLPIIGHSLGSETTIGILAANKTLLTRQFIACCGVRIENPLAIYDLLDNPTAPGKSSLAGATNIGEEAVLDTEKAETDLVSLARQLLAEHPNTGAIVFESGNFPPYAKAVQDATGVPVFDTLTLTDFLFAATHPKTYQGFM